MLLDRVVQATASMGVVIYKDRVVHGPVLKLAETQKWRAELLESLETAATECFV